MNKSVMVSESIWNNKEVIIPMAEVSHVVKERRGIWIVFKHSRYNQDSGFTMKYEPAVWLNPSDGSKFQKSWCYYRGELDQVFTPTKTEQG